jgi:putative salt-induced outer membrane protein YdiY
MSVTGSSGLRSVGFLFWIATACALVAGLARADTVTLHNGDRLTGRILHVSASTLTIETAWAGELRIPRYEVSAIETDKPVSVLREGADRTESMTMGAGAPGTVTLTPEPEDRASAPAFPEGSPSGAVVPRAASAAATSVPLARLRYVNPTPEESGEGVSYEGRVTLSGAMVRGNSTGERVYAESDLAARALDWRYALNAKLRRERASDSTTVSNWLVGGNFDRFVGDRRFVYLRGSLERDRFRDVASRVAAGVGYGLQLVQTERARLSLRAGFDAIDVRRIAGADETWPALGWGANLAYRLDALSAELFHDQQGFLNLRDASQMNVRSRSGLRVPFVSGLVASLQLNLDWDSEPASGRRSTDATWLIGLGYAW